MAEPPVIIIFNPVSGSGRSRILAEGLGSALDELGLPARLEPTRCAGDATSIAKKWEEGSRALVAVGGDGTIREVAQGMSGQGAPLAVLPAGTANVLAAELRLPGDPTGAARVIAADRRRLLDRFELSTDEGEGRRGLLFAGIGYDGAVVHRLAQVRTERLERGGSGNISKLTYLRPVLRTLCKRTPVDLEVEVDGNPLAGGPWGWVLVTNVSSYGGILHLGEHIDPDDGRLDLLAFPATSPWQLLRYGLAGMLDLLPRMRGVSRARVREEVRVRGAAPRPVQLDGDAAGFSPLTIRRLDSRVPVLVPPPRTAAGGSP